MEKVGVYWRLLAVRYLDKGLYGDAHDAALKGLRHYPDSSGLFYVAGLSAAFLSKAAAAEKGGGAEERAAWLRTAEASYRRSIEIDPRNSRSLYGLAVLYTFELDNHEAAIGPIEALLATDPRNVDALFIYARALYGSGRLQDSADAYDRILATTKVDEKKQQAADNKKRILDELYGK
jgi:tetratricopeptide (TPR) repeat protein